nr:MAG TPA: hypothetical protein [Caudoviricetes sp.]
MLRRGGPPPRHQHCKTKQVPPANGAPTEFKTTFLGSPEGGYVANLSIQS